MLKNKFRYHFIFIITLFFLSLSSIQSQDIHSLKELSKGFTLVAKKATPAVVSIKVKKSRRMQGLSEEDIRYMDPFDFFDGDRFFQHFFGRIPKRSRPHQPIYGQGSGFIVTPDGYILTNNHVVNDAEEVIVLLSDGREFEAKIIGQDENSDIAVIKIESKNLPFLTLGDSDSLEVGQWAIAVGNPLGLQSSVSVGVVSGTGRNGLDIANFEDFIQTDAAINMGNSGGPLLDLDGNVIGINTAIATKTGGYMGIGFAIPSKMAQYIMEQLIDHGSVVRGYLGITMQNIDNDLAESFHLESVKGALVTEVVDHSPAKKAGIKQGDIILKYDNTPIENIQSFRNNVSLMKPGSKIKLTIKRDNQIIEIPVTIASYPESLSGAQKVNEIGFDVIDIKEAKSQEFANEQGVIVNKVEPSSAAAAAGIRKGQLIVAVNQKKISSKEEFYQAIASIKKGDRLLLLLKQGNITRFIAFKIK